MPLIVSLVDRRAGRGRRGRDLLATFETREPLATGQTLRLADSTIVVVLGVRDVIPPDGATEVHPWDQVAFVGTFEPLLDA